MCCVGSVKSKPSSVVTAAICTGSSLCCQTLALKVIKLKLKVLVIFDVFGEADYVILRGR